MLRIIKVQGDSMSPDLQDQDFLLVILKPFFKIKKGQIIIFKTPHHGLMVKKIKDFNRKEIIVVGSHPYSVDSREFGPINHKQVYGKMLYHISQKHKHMIFRRIK